MEQYFERLIKSGQLSHAYYLEGGKGLDFSLWLATHVLCCGTDCMTCESIKSFNHPDVMVVSPETTAIKVDQIRELHEKAAYKSFVGNGQVFIIDKADTMNLQASNALLKFLEEPKDNVLILLLGNDSNKLIETILSRVQVVTLPFHKDFMELAIQKGLDFRCLPLFEELNYSLDLTEKYSNVADEWFLSIRDILVKPQATALQQAQQWDELFSDKEAKLIAISFIQSYVKALFNQRKGTFHNWGSIPTYDWERLFIFGEAVDELTRAVRSNGQFMLHIENFIKKTI